MPDVRPNILDVAGAEPRESAEFGVLVPAGRAGRLGTALAGMAHELAASRREIAVLQRENATLRARLGGRQVSGIAGDAARERLGQDLHDGVQQRLTALRIRVAVAGQRFEARDDQTASVVLNDIGDEVDQAIDEVRAFAHGVYPALLTHSGLRAALASVGRRSPGRVSIHVSGVGRYCTEIETAVYFSCLAALDNAAKHAGSAPATVRVWDHGDALQFTVSDTGHGFDRLITRPGAGITNMHDRIDAVGGNLTIDSSSRGTVVAGSVPHAA
jgi:signal transduction histidine kinase